MLDEVGLAGGNRRAEPVLRHFDMVLWMNIDRDYKNFIRRESFSFVKLFSNIVVSHHANIATSTFT